MNQIRMLVTLVALLFTLPVGADSAPAQQGTLSLNTADFKQAGMAKLDGEWAFYWQQLLSPGELAVASASPSTISIPGLWNNGAVEGISYDAFGYATLVLNIELPPEKQNYLLKMQSLPSAYRLWANGEVVAENGIVGKDQGSEQPWFSPKVVPIYVDQASLQLVLQISNFHHKEGGVWRSFVLATPDHLFDIRDLPVISDAFLFALLFAIGLYYVALFVLRRKERAAFWFGLFCLAIGSRSILVGERLFYGFDLGLSWATLQTFEHVLFFLCLPTFTWFFYYLFPSQVKKWLPQVSSVICALTIVATLLLPTYLYAHLSFPYQIFVLLMSVPILFFMAKLIADRKKGSWLFGLSFLMLFAAVLHDLLYTHFIVHGRPMVQLGVIAFVITQSMILNRRYVQSLSLVEAMTRELKSRNEELVKLDQVKDDFLAHTSHELRTPIHGIAGLAHALLLESEKNGNGKITDHQSHQLTLIESSAKRLGYLVNEILDFSKLKHQELSLKLGDVNLASVLGVTVRLLEPLVASKPVTFKSDIPPLLPAVKADENRLQQILFNLIGNAVKYTSRGEIRVKASVLEGFVEISIEDTGPGISDAHRDVLFEPFKQLNRDSDSGVEGTGLGLSITQKLLELHNSKLCIDSEEGKGTRVHFLLPIASGALISEAKADYLVTDGDVVATHDLLTEHDEVNATPVMPPVEKGRSHRILVVDDEEVNRQVSYSQLRVEGYQVVLCASGEEALELLEHDKPDLVLLDLMMPQMNGFEVCDAIREQYDRFELPVLMLTASHQMDDVVKALNIGANDYLSKPYHEEELFARVYSLINASESQQRAQENQRLQVEVTRRKEAQDKLRLANQRLVNLLDNADESILLLDPLGRILYSNRAARGLLDDDLIPLKGQPIDEVISTDLLNDLRVLSSSDRPKKQKTFLQATREDRTGGEQTLAVYAACFELRGQLFINLFIPPENTGLTLHQSTTDLHSISQDLTASQERISSLESMVQEIVSSTSLGRLAAENTRPGLVRGNTGEVDLRLLLVNTLRLSLSLWEQYTGKSKVELAEESKIWRVYIDGSTFKTRTFDKYLSVKTLPKKPRWRSVIRTASYVKLQCAITETERAELDHLIDAVERESIDAGS